MTFILKSYLFPVLCARAYMCRCLHAMARVGRSEEDLVESVLFLHHVGSRDEQTSGPQAWQQASLPAEPSHLLSFLFFFLSTLFFPLFSFLFFSVLCFFSTEYQKAQAGLKLNL